METKKTEILTKDCVEQFIASWLACRLSECIQVVYSFPRPDDCSLGCFAGVTSPVG